MCEQVENATRSDIAAREPSILFSRKLRILLTSDSVGRHTNRYYVHVFSSTPGR